MHDSIMKHYYPNELKIPRNGPVTFYGKKVTRRACGKLRVKGSKLLTKVINKELGKSC